MPDRRSKVGPGRALVVGLALVLSPSLLAAPALLAASDAPSRSRAAVAAEHLRDSPQLLGDPWGARSELRNAGLVLQLFFNTVTGAKLRGGAESGNAYRNSGSYDFFALADLEELGLLEGLSLFLHAKGNYGRNINPKVRALSDPIDDADFDEGIYVTQLWAQQEFAGGRIRLRAGYQDQQTVFDRNAVANSEDIQFLSTFLDNNPVVPLKIGLAATLLLQPLPWLDIVLATADADNAVREVGFDTAFDGFDSLNGYAEATVRHSFTSRRGPLPGGYRLGMFLDNSSKEILNGDEPSQPVRRARGHLGGYLSFDQLAFREGSSDEQGLGLFVRYGIADDEVNMIAQFWSVGLQYLGALPGRDRDVLGLAAYQTIPSSHAASTRSCETGVELYYRLDVLPWLALTPDLQFIAAPGGSSSARNAVVIALRARVSL